MGVKIKDTVTVDGKKFRKTLKELTQNEVRIGFQRGAAKEDDGTDICDIAAWNEFGTDHIPARPFLRKSVDENLDEIGSFFEQKRDDLLRGASAKMILNDIGLFQEGLVQDKIIDGEFVPNAPSTIKRKEKKNPPAKPLIDSSHMLQNVNYIVQRKGGGGE